MSSAVSDVPGFEHKVLICPVTALHFLDNLLLSGEGPFLHIYDTNRCERLNSYRVFIDAVIHGIKQNFHANDESPNKLVCVFGSKKLRILSIDESGMQITAIGNEIELDDWIWDVKWLSQNKGDECTASVQQKKDSGNALACVLGHNSVCYIQSPGKEEDLAEYKIVHCEEKCILYSAHCIGQSWENLVVASGTVFNQIVLWKPDGECNAQGRCPVVHRLIGHEGVIFAMDFSFEKQLLASVSDDRSIRLWKITSHLEKYSPSEMILHLDNIEISPDQVLYGHKARVWDVMILDKYLVSVGEDATCCVWNYTGDVIMKHKGHKGKSIWSMAVNKSELKMATGGGDCSVRLWSLDTEDLSETPPQRTDILRLPTNKADDFPRSLAVVSPGDIYVMTNDGVLWKHKLILNKWTKVMEDSEFSSYSVLSCSQATNAVALGNISGNIKILLQDCCIDHALYSGKVHSILWLKEDPALEKNTSHLLTTGPDGCIDIFEVNQSTHSLDKQYHFNLPYTKQRWVSAALILHTERLLVCGDRGGTVHVYSLQDQAEAPIQSYWKLHGKTGVTDLCYHKDHLYSCGRDGLYRIYTVTDGKVHLLSAHKVFKGFEWIAQLEVTDTDILALGFHADQFILYSTENNQRLISIPCGGGHRAWDFIYGNNHLLEHLHSDSRDYFLVYIKNRDIVCASGKVEDSHTIVKSSLHGRELCDVKHLFTVQGARILATAGEDTVVNILALESIPNTGEMNSYIISSLEGHLSSVRTLAVSGKVNHNIDIVDTNPTIYNHHDHSKTENLNTVGSSSKILFSGGGRAEIKAWKITCIVPDVIKSATSPEENEKFQCWHEFLAGHSLMQKQKQGYKPWKHQHYDPDPETRYMDLTAFTLDQILSQRDTNKFGILDQLHIVISACSDGFVRVIAFNERDKSYQVLAECTYHDHCVLKVKHLILPASEEKNKMVYVISAATDGKIALWDITNIVYTYSNYLKKKEHGTMDNSEAAWNCQENLMEFFDLGQVINISVPMLTVDVHQSGINALRICLLSDVDILIATGGDDNAIVITKLKRGTVQGSDNEKAASFSVVRQNKVLKAHSGEITGLKWFSETRLMSVSIDQRLVLWNIDSDLNMEVIACKFINVADICNIDVWEERDSHYIALSGVGLQVLKSISS